MCRADQHGADLAVARHQMERARRHAGGVQQLHRFKSDERRLLGGLRHHRVAGGERSRDLAGENRQWKIPRADADEHAAAAVAQLIALAGRPRQLLRHQRAARRGRIIAAEVGCFADFRHAIVDGLAALALQQRNQTAAVLLDQIAGAVECGRARRHAGGVPGRKTGGRRRHRRRHDRLVAVLHGPKDRSIDRRDNISLGAGQRDAVDQRRRIGGLWRRADLGQQRVERA